jgi:hypothetical protein
MTKTRIATAALGCLLLAGGLATAQKPARNVSGARHPNLAAAQRFAQQAWNKVVEAQRANEWDMSGHAQKAKELLDQVNNELKQAAQAANRNRSALFRSSRSVPERTQAPEVCAFTRGDFPHSVAGKFCTCKQFFPP